MIIVLTGATGTGKSEFAIKLAKLIDGEIINADAFQVYQELGIATAKPSKEMRSIVPHHLFDFVPLHENYDVAAYQKDLRGAIDLVEASHKNVIIAGGTGLYIRAGLFDYDFKPLPDFDMTPYLGMSDDELFAKLSVLDPIEAKKLHPHNRIRVLRSLQICLASGESKTARNAKQSHKPIYPCLFYGLQMDREELYPRVEKRVDDMFSRGLVEEDKKLIDKYGRTPHAFQAIGVKELFPYFDGSSTLEESKNLIKENTRHYIKRQETFFRHQFEIKWVNGIEEIAEDLK